MSVIPQDRTEEHFLDCLDYITKDDSDIDDSGGHDDDEEEDEERAFGVTHVSPLNNLTKFQMIDGFVQDDLHFARLGIAEQFTNYWFNSKTSPLEKTLSNAIVAEIDKLMDSITVPHQAMRLTRPFSERAHWKGKEWENWILHYSLPIMELYLDENYLKHWALFVEAFYISSQKVITMTDLRKVDYLMKTFLADMEKLYSKNATTYNAHMGSHWGKGQFNWGPSWAHNTFAFESGNGKLLRMIKAANGVNHQICRQLSMRQCDLLLSNHILSNSSPKIQKYCFDLVNRNTKKTCKLQSARYFGAPKVAKENWIQKLKLTNAAVCYNRMVKDKCLYSSTVKQNERSNNSYAQLSNGSFVKIINFIVDEKVEKEYVLFHHLITENAFRNQHPYLKKMIRLEKSIRATPVIMLEKIAVCIKTNNYEYISSVPNLFYM